MKSMLLSMNLCSRSKLPRLERTASIEHPARGCFILNGATCPDHSTHPWTVYCKTPKVCRLLDHHIVIMPGAALSCKETLSDHDGRLTFRKYLFRSTSYPWMLPVGTLSRTHLHAHVSKKLSLKSVYGCSDKTKFPAIT